MVALALAIGSAVDAFAEVDTLLPVRLLPENAGADHARPAAASVAAARRHSWSARSCRA